MITTAIHPNDYTVMPWKNGLGKTTEIAQAAHPDKADGYAWRISIADIVTDGPFSRFDGYQRLIATITGAGMELAVDGTRHVIHHRDPAFSFSGDAQVDCRLLDGPIRDFNLIYDPRIVSGAVTLLASGAEEKLNAPTNATVFIHALDSVVHVNGYGLLKSGHSLRLDQVEDAIAIRCAENAGAVITTITPAA